MATVNALYEEYKNQLPPEERMAAQVNAEVTSDEGSGPAPKGFKPLTNQERGQWNNFIRFVREKGLIGSTDLDQRDKSIGRALLAEYKKANPDFSITEARIPDVQYEFQLMKDTGSLPNVDSQSFAGSTTLPWFKGELGKKDISGVDGWFGSLTSRQAYPEVAPFSDDPDKRYYGTDYDAADQYYKTSKNWEGRRKQQGL